MLKIKSNTNEFTIIFFWEDSKENKCWKIICSALSIQHPFSVPALFFFFFQRYTSLPFFLFLFQRLSFFCFSLSFLFSSRVPFFQPKNILFSPKQFSLQPKNIFFSPNVFQPKSFLVFLQPKCFLLQFSDYSLLLFFCFILFWFSPLFSLSAPPFFSPLAPPLFLFFSSVYPRPNILFSCFTSLLFE